VHDESIIVELKRNECELGVPNCLCLHYRHHAGQ
jgi:hypothetical protein